MTPQCRRSALNKFIKEESSLLFADNSLPNDINSSLLTFVVDILITLYNYNYIIRCI